MEIGVDVSRTAEPKSGLHSYTRSLLEALARIDRVNRYRLHPFVPQCFPADYKRAFCPRRRNFSMYGGWSLRRRVEREWRAHPDPERFFDDEPDVFFSPHHYVPSRHYARLVCVFHDVAWHVHPEFSSAANLELCTRNFEHARRKADRIITVSHHARSEMIRHLGVRPDDVVAIPLAASPVFRPLARARIPRRIRRDFGEPPEWVLFVGTNEPRKNLLTLLRALAIVLQHGRRRPRLLAAGGPGWLNADVYREIDVLGLQDHVHFAGQADDAELLQLYNAATVVVCPSIYEGFGLPLLEALQCGAPVIASRVASFPEVAGDAVAYVDDPRDAEGFARHIEALLADAELRAQLRGRGPERARAFSWDRCARATLDVIEQVHADARFHRTRLSFGEDERAAVSGWHETERDPTSHFRWTREHAIARLHGRPGELVVDAACGTAGQLLEVTVRGRPIGACRLTPPWQEFRFVVDGDCTGEVDVGLRVDVTVPDAAKPGDRRTLGARVRRVEFCEPRPQPS